MTTTTATKTARTIVASTSNAAGSTTRGTLDLRTKLGGVLHIKMTNGTTGQSYKITARLGTAGGREKEADILVQVAET